MARLSASLVRDFVVPTADPTPSSHGSQREDYILETYLPGWCREASSAAKAAFLPGVDPVKEGNGRGRGATGIDGFRVNPARAAGGDFVSLKAPAYREKEGTYPSGVELFKGTRETLAAFVAAVRGNYGSRKAFPLAVVHMRDGEIDGWEIRDLGVVVSAFTNEESWALWHGVPVKPVNDRKRGAGGSPASVWVSLLRRESVGFNRDGSVKYAYIPDENGTYATLNTSFSKRSGAKFHAGTPAQFAADLDAATVLSR